MPFTTEIIASNTSDTERSFADDLDHFQKKYQYLWRTTEASLPDFGETVSASRQHNNARAADRFTDEIEARLRELPKDKVCRELWIQDLRLCLKGFATTLGMPANHRDVVFSDDFFHVTTDFVHWARDFDPSLELESLFQALRNVWIMNILRRILGYEMACTPSVFAYSMLYPVTDNFLDDRDQSATYKRKVSHWLGQRLRGESSLPRDRYQTDLSRLVGLIESEYSHALFPRVWDSLLAIHRSQVESLDQQVPSIADGDDLLRLSIAKGGSSVLADGYLVSGDLSHDHADFIFGFGVVLQLLDDIQDIESDHQAGHRTIFTESLAPEVTASRLFRFIDHVLDATPLLSTRHNGVIREIIRSNCRLLLLHAAAFHEKLFPASFLHTLECHAPLPFAFLKQRRGSIHKRSLKVRKILRRRGIKSVFDVFGAR